MQRTPSLALFLLVSSGVAGVLGSSSGVSQADKTVTHRVTFDINQGHEHLGSITLELYGRMCPKTVKNFVTIASGTAPKKYEGTTFHRVIQNFMLQGGDVDHKNGMGSWSIYGSRFADENFILKHSEPYMLSMANAGKDTNGSQFFITTVATPWLDGKHVVFGKVIEGQDVVKKIEGTRTNSQDAPVEPCYIARSRVEEIEPLP